jgi:hypothetical protein
MLPIIAPYNHNLYERLCVIYFLFVWGMYLFTEDRLCSTLKLIALTKAQSILNNCFPLLNEIFMPCDIKDRKEDGFT